MWSLHNLHWIHTCSFLKLHLVCNPIKITPDLFPLNTVGLSRHILNCTLGLIFGHFITSWPLYCGESILMVVLCSHPPSSSQSSKQDLLQLAMFSVSDLSPVTISLGRPSIRSLAERRSFLSNVFSPSLFTLYKVHPSEAQKYLRFIFGAGYQFCFIWVWSTYLSFSFISKWQGKNIPAPIHHLSKQLWI